MLLDVLDRLRGFLQQMLGQHRRHAAAKRKVGRATHCRLPRRPVFFLGEMGWLSRHMPGPWCAMAIVPEGPCGQTVAAATDLGFENAGYFWRQREGRAMRAALRVGFRGRVLAAGVVAAAVIGVLLLGEPALRKQAAEKPAPAGAAQPPAAPPGSEGPRDNSGAVPTLPARLAFSTSGWKTDFSTHSVPLTEIISGGPPRDGIPPIDRPKFETVNEASRWLQSPEPVIYLSINGDARAYPLQILTWHEVVNDEVGGTPVTVTFCPLCNTAIAFDRRLDGRVLDFGTSGNLRHSDLVMWDRQTESWWQQALGEAIVGQLTGQRLTMVPASIVSWASFREQFPRGRVLSPDTGYGRDYGRNPYLGYDRADQTPFLYRGPMDGRLLPMERVVAVSVGGEDVAYPFRVLQDRRAIADRVGDQPIVVLWEPGTASALDGSSIANSRDVGATGVFLAEIDGRALTFRWEHGAFVDAQTGSRWTVLAHATAGALAGRQLEPVLHSNPFWFVWAVFKPGTRIYG